MGIVRDRVTVTDLCRRSYPAAVPKVGVRQSSAVEPGTSVPSRVTRRQGGATELGGDREVSEALRREVDRGRGSESQVVRGREV